MPFEFQLISHCGFFLPFSLTHTDLKRVCAPSGAKSRVGLLPVVQITLFVFQFDCLFVGFLGRTGWCAVKSSPAAGPGAEE